MKRLPGLDAARAFAVIAMVMGHSLDSVLSAAAREAPAMAAYWQFRTFTAPLFLLVSGWAVMTSVTAHDLAGWAVVKRYLPRVGLLFFWGFFLRLPVWDMPGLFRFDEALWQHFFAFDALQVIATSLLMGLGVLAFLKSKAQRMAALALLAVVFPLSTHAVWQQMASSNAPLWVKQVLGGGVSPFPVFPWAGFFFVGALLGLGLTGLSSTRHKVALLTVCGLLAMALTGKTPIPLLAPSSPLLFSWRLGVPFLIFAATLLVPAAWASRVAPIGRASLWVYVIHLPITYGWAWWRGLDTRVGHSLDAWPALGVALSVTAFSVIVALSAQRLLALTRARRRTMPTSSSAALPEIENAEIQTSM